MYQQSRFDRQRSDLRTNKLSVEEIHDNRIFNIWITWVVSSPCNNENNPRWSSSALFKCVHEYCTVYIGFGYCILDWILDFFVCVCFHLRGRSFFCRLHVRRTHRQCSFVGVVSLQNNKTIPRGEIIVSCTTTVVLKYCCLLMFSIMVFNNGVNNSINNSISNSRLCTYVELHQVPGDIYQQVFFTDLLPTGVDGRQRRFVPTLFIFYWCYYY